MAFEPEGNLVVTEFSNHRVPVSDLAHLRSIGSQGEGNGQFNGPWGVAFRAAGHIIVSENGGHRVQEPRYCDGSHVFTIGSQGSGNGQFSSTHGGIAIDSDGRIVVADSGNHRVQVSV